MVYLVGRLMCMQVELMEVIGGCKQNTFRDWLTFVVLGTSLL